jgi:hypothetical protein
MITQTRLTRLLEMLPQSSCYHFQIVVVQRVGSLLNFEI